ncbi:MAG: endonuclease/exonuclease/phosphatase family protein [Phycisphaerales bacterium]|nr:MAG: endonuclease/exonuclease/phosphatase family protein [Phycisphaerales bacterium]
MWQTVVVAGMALAAMSGDRSRQTVRIAAFNVWELSARKLGQVDANGHGLNPQLRKAAQIIQRVRPDILLINEIDFDAGRRENAAAFRDRYLKVGQSGQDLIDYPHVFFAPVNTGVPTGHDLDNDGTSAGPADAFGFGRYPGQYGMALYSRYSLDATAARTFQRFLWKDMPNNLMPDGQNDRPAWYSADEAAILRLSSKSHWDVPVHIGDTVLHVLASHPTPPVFDGPEDRNGRRAFDEVRLWADYLTGGEAAGYLVDDRGRGGGLQPGALFVILGDLNADPVKDRGAYGRPAIDQLLAHPRVQDPAPKSEGGAAHASSYPGDKACRTCDFGRIDYVLPCRELTVRGSGVFWPAPDDPLRSLVDKPEPSSDHRLVWVDVVIERAEAEKKPKTGN